LIADAVAAELEQCCKGAQVEAALRTQQRVGTAARIWRWCENAADAAVQALEPGCVHHAGWRRTQLLFIVADNCAVVLVRKVELLHWVDAAGFRIPASSSSSTAQHQQRAACDYPFLRKTQVLCLSHQTSALLLLYQTE
jgi:hypothetical protein